jgi:PAS domain S-box-containing protein
VQEGLEQILERAGVGVAQLDTSGRYLLVNESYCAMIGRTRTELLAGRIQDFTHPEDLARSLDAFIRAIETGSPVEIEQRCLRSDGSVVHLRNSISVARDDRAAPLCVVAVTQNLGGHAVQEASLAPTEGDLRLLLDCAADGFCCVDRNGRTTLCNAAFLRMLGYRQDEDLIGRDFHEVVRHSSSDGIAHPKEERPVFKVIQSGTHAHIIDEMVFRVDGTRFPAEYWIRPIVRDGEIQGAVCTLIDLTERKQAESRQELLNRELAHRVKNTLAMVQAIVDQTLRTSATPRGAMSSINQRLVALGNAHNVLMRTYWGNASIMDIVEGAIALHRSEDQRIRVGGPRLDVGSKAALAITLALHELCTNAAKYGALSREGGTVSIEWLLAGGAADATFRMSWKEQGGPPVTPPTRKGFGSRLVGQLIGSDLRGTAKLTFDPQGLQWTLEAPLTGLRQ